jgi:rhodanese-related sulfurtransferase
MTINQKLAAAAATLALLALVAGNGVSTREAAYVGALELAEWIREQRAGLRIIDLRDAGAYEQFHLPRAEHVALERIAELTAAAGATVVLYAADDAHAVQARSALDTKSADAVLLLRGGVHAWLDSIMSPPASADARTRELSSYFGGRPYTGAAGATLDQKIQRAQRRGC